MMQAHSARRGTVAVISLRGRRPDSSAAGDLTRAGTSAVFKYLSPLNAKKTKGIEILQDPLWNKGSAFTGEERERLGIRGLLPPVVKTLEQQRDGFLRRLAAEPDDLHKNLMLQGLHDRNETLFHRVLIDEIDMIAPLVYTPTVGRVCQEFSQRYTRPRGMVFTPADRGQMSVMMQNWPNSDCQVVVATDGSRILGLGDLGANGMGIPIGKLALYCGAGGIAPHRVLPVMLDFGTNNEELLADPEYRGWREPRLQGEAYFSLVDEFMQAIFKKYRTTLVQFEDFGSDKAAPLLDKYRNKYLCFNDDIQGTGATVLAGVLGALRLQGRPPEDIAHLKVAVVGAGSAGAGVAGALLQAKLQAGCASVEEAAASFVMFDAAGVVGKGRLGLPSEVQPFCREDIQDRLGLEEVLAAEKPELILGLSGRKGTITEGAIRIMGEAHSQPIVMPLSNPTSQAEITPEQAYRWTDGRAIVATGSPFDPIEMDGKLLVPSQCNNMYIFPGLGLGASVTAAETVPDSMLYHAAVALSKMTTEAEMEQGRVFPSLNKIREVSQNVAVAVASHAYDIGIARTPVERGETVESFVGRKMYYPEYVPLFSKTR